MAGFIKGYICRSKNSNIIMIGTPTKNFKEPKKKEDGRYWYISGWFYTMSVRVFKRAFGFSIKPGTHKPVNIIIVKAE